MGRETAFFFWKEKPFIMGAAGTATTVLCVCVCLCVFCLGMCVCFLSELMFFVNVYKCVCTFVLSLHRGDTHLTKVSSV